MASNQREKVGNRTCALARALLNSGSGRRERRLPQLASGTSSGDLERILDPCVRMSSAFCVPLPQSGEITGQLHFFHCSQNPPAPRNSSLNGQHRSAKTYPVCYKDFSEFLFSYKMRKPSTFFGNSIQEVLFTQNSGRRSVTVRVFKFIMQKVLIQNQTLFIPPRK